MKVNNINSNVNFKGPLDGVITTVLRTCDMNEMVNAVGLDVGAMVIPRAYYDTKYRNSYAGAETFFREISGTFINCLSAGIFAKGISKIATPKVMPEIKMSSDTWYSYDSLNTLKEACDKTGNVEGYSKTVFENIAGLDGHAENKFKDIEKASDYIKRNMNDKDHIYKKCSKCKTTLKLPIPYERGIKHTKCPKCNLPVGRSPVRIIFFFIV